MKFNCCNQLSLHLHYTCANWISHWWNAIGHENRKIDLSMPNIIQSNTNILYVEKGHVRLFLKLSTIPHLAHPKQERDQSLIFFLKWLHIILLLIFKLYLCVHSCVCLCLQVDHVKLVHAISSVNVGISIFSSSINTFHICLWIHSWLILSICIQSVS